MGRKIVEELEAPWHGWTRPLLPSPYLQAANLKDNLVLFTTVLVMFVYGGKYGNCHS